MPKSSKPRRAYRPKPIGRPMLDRMRNDLITPAYVALEVLMRTDDADAQESARHTLTALLDYTFAALKNASRDTEVMLAGLDAIQSMDDRFSRLGTYRPSGQELARLRAAVIHADQTLPLLRTDQVMAACLEVDRAIAKACA